MSRPPAPTPAPAADRTPPGSCAPARAWTVPLPLLLAALERSSTTALGRQGEDVARLALLRAPATREGLVAVHTWADWAARGPALDAATGATGPGRRVADTGIDLVAEYADGRTTAVQVKLRTSAPGRVGWAELATFAAKSAGGPFTDRLLVLLGEATLSTHARAELAAQHELKALTVWHAHDVEQHAGRAWPADHAGVLAALGAPRPAPLAAAPLPLRAHQRAAVQAITDTFAAGSDRAQLVMACGTGKTLTGHAAATALNAGSVLVLAPSLALLRQLVGVWRRQCAGTLEAVAVCSDPTVGAPARGEDRDEVALGDGDVGVPTLADPAHIAAFLTAAPTAPTGPEGPFSPRVVFATYQSSPRIAAAQAITGPAGTFDLVIADEAHYLAGHPSPAFGTVLDGAAIRARHRLFTTATPRLLAAHLRGQGRVWASMDDAAVFGPVAHRLTFGQAIQADLLADYRLLVLGADQSAAEAIRARAITEAGVRTDARTLAAALAVLRLAREHGRRRIVTFHSRISSAATFARLLATHPRWAPAELHVDLGVETVTGAQRTDERAAALARLARAGQPGQPAVRVVTNARCLTAGVDVPALDAVVFVDPRHSRIDVVQAVGRVLRRAEGKDAGYVVVPVPVPGAGQVSAGQVAAAAAGGGFSPVWDVLAAMADHDDTLTEQIEAGRRELGRAGVPGDGCARLVVDVPGYSTQALAAAVWLRAVTQLGSGWAAGLGALEAFVAARGHARVPHGYLQGEFPLGTWVRTRRSARYRGHLSAERVAVLDSLGFCWSPQEEDFTAGLAALASFLAREGHTVVPVAHVEDGHRLGRWIHQRRSDRTRGCLSADRIAALDRVGMSWDPSGAAFAAGLDALGVFVAREGHARVRRDHVEGGHPLGKWVLAQRRARAAGELGPDRTAALEGLGMVWALRADKSARALAALEVFLAREGHARVPVAHHEDGFALGAWVSARRLDRGAGRLTPAQVAALDRLGMVWDVAGEGFEVGLAALAGFVRREGHALVPQSHLEDGLALGVWVSARRFEHARGRLAQPRVEALDALGMVWDARGAQFAAGLAALAAFTAREGHGLVPKGHREGEVPLGSWVSNRRIEQAAGELSPERVAALEAAGMVWDVRAENFQAGLVALAAFTAREGHARVPQRHREAGFALGGWVSHRRRARQDGQLSLGQVAALEQLGMVWDALADDFDAGLAALVAFTGREGHARVPKSHLEAGFALGKWVSSRRQDHRAGRLGAQRVAALDQAGMVWEPRADRFEVGLGALAAFARREGHARVPALCVQDGFPLGRWLRVQRRAAATDRLTPARAGALDGLGVDWRGGPDRAGG